ncbi:MAG: hypothetical protein IT289_06835 [Oligoflexia bacterium]|nr:hypothetical protein [Oligoflexia bacterium]
MRVSLIAILILLVATPSAQAKGNNDCYGLLDRLSGAPQKVQQALTQTDPKVALDRVVQPLLAIHKILEGAPTEEVILAKILKSNIRLQFFKLEAIFRIYTNSKKVLSKKERKRAKKNHKLIIEMEDVIGRFVDDGNLIEEFRKLKVPQQLIDYAIQKSHESQAHLLKSLKEFGWLDTTQAQSAYERVLESALDFSDVTNRKDRDFWLTRISKKFNNLMKEEYDLDLIEEGVHELRRDLRWLNIYAAAIGGYVQVIDRKSPIDEIQDVVLDPSQAKYAELPKSPHQKRTVFVTQDLFYQLINVVGEFGKLKDYGLKVEALAEAALETGYKKNRREALAWAIELVEAQYGKLDVVGEAKKLHAFLERTELLEVISREIASQI